MLELRKLPILFPAPDYKFQLDPSYEPKRSKEELESDSIPSPDPSKTVVFSVLQNYRSVDLVRPVGAKHMYDAAMTSKYCELTTLGKHYRRLVERKLI
ncbi:hypothetical protein AJ87_07415 [Rhizobium yanglingense]|nr:hypothetical protein AJ87_07415 [Rhizobium yanglingense]